MQENIKISKIDKKNKQTIKKNYIFTKKCCISRISFGQMSENEST